MTDLDTVNEFIGQKLRQRRTALGMTMIELANRLQISYQQVQKYEKGHNQVSAARLQQLAILLDVQVTFFLPEDPRNIEISDEEHGGKNRSKISLVRDFDRLKDQKTRQAIKQLVGSLAEQQSAA